MALKKVRMLVAATVDGIDYTCSAPVEFEAVIAKQLIKAGKADGTAAAVRYAIDVEGQMLLVHPSDKNGSEEAGASEPGD